MLCASRIHVGAGVGHYAWDLSFGELKRLRPRRLRPRRSWALSSGDANRLSYRKPFNSHDSRHHGCAIEPRHYITQQSRTRLAQLHLSRVQPNADNPDWSVNQVLKFHGYFFPFLVCLRRVDPARVRTVSKKESKHSFNAPACHVDSRRMSRFHSRTFCHAGLITLFGVAILTFQSPAVARGRQLDLISPSSPDEATDTVHVFWRRVDITDNCLG